MNPDREVFFDIFKHILIKNRPKCVPTPPKVSGFHLNPSHSKTQAFTYPKTYWNKISKQNSKMRKVWKPHQSGPCICQEMILWPLGQWRKRWERLGEEESFKLENSRKKNQIVRRNERKEIFVEKRWKLENWRECEEMREMKRMKRKKEIVGNRRWKMKRSECIWWLNYM